VVYFVSGEDTNSVLCGFTITGGSGTLTPLYSNGYIYRSGGGVFCKGAYGTKIINNHITNNRIISSYASGGGILFYNDNSYLIFERNRVTDNYLFTEVGWAIGGGAEFGGDKLFARVVANVFERDTLISETYAMGGGADIAADPGLANGLVQGNVFKNNIADAKVNNGLGGGFGCYSTGDLEIRDNLFEGNIAKSRDAWGEGGAILIDDEYLTLYGRKIVSGNRFINNQSIGQSASAGGGAIEIFRTIATVSGNYFDQNTAQSSSSYGGAIRIVRSAFKLENNIFCENSATWGGAVYITGLPQMGTGMDFINNTIINNIASSIGGGIRVYDVPVNIINSILWGNSPDQIAVNSGSVIAQYNDIQGGWTGTGNINVDPLFVPGDSLYNLSDLSFCIGAGADSTLGYSVPPLDYDGDPRPNPSGCMPDIGAQESPECTPVTGIEEVNSDIPKVFTLKQNYPNPFNPRTTIEFSIPKTETVKLKIYNLLGQEVTTLVSDKLTPGEYKYTWDASQLASGVYYYKITAGNYVDIKKLILLK